MENTLPGGTAGDRLRRRRRALHLTLAQVAEEAGITTGYLSQLERGVVSGAVGTLQRVCAALKLSVGDLFQDPASSAGPVLRSGDARRIVFGNGASKTKLTPPHFDHLEVLMGVFEPGGDTGSEPYTHGHSEELLVVLEGQVRVTVEGTTRELGPYDSLHYRSSQPHRVVEATGTDSARVLWTMAPPTY